jgi:hypothetical protein
MEVNSRSSASRTSTPKKLGYGAPLIRLELMTHWLTAS